MIGQIRQVKARVSTNFQPTSVILNLSSEKVDEPALKQEADRVLVLLEVDLGSK